MKIDISDTKEEMALKAAKRAAQVLQKSLEMRSKSCFIAATGASQFEFLDFLCKMKNIDWNRTEMFHLDEYIGLAATHPASFRRYLQERLVERVKPEKVHFINGDTLNPEDECIRISNVILEKQIDVAFIGIGENGHLAFNDPPADFETEQPFIIVDLDEKCRKQQVGEGWFSSIEEVPQKAITMSIEQIMKSKIIICICPDKRKSNAVRECLSTEASVSPSHPASILKQHDRAYIYLDKESSSLLK